MRLGKTGVHCLHPYGVMGLAEQGQSSSVEAVCCLQGVLGFVIDQPRMQLTEYSVSGSGCGKPGQKAASQGGGWVEERKEPASHLALVSFFFYLELTREVSKPAIRATSSSSHLSLTFCHKVRLQSLKAQMVDSGVLALLVYKLIPLQT